MQQQPPSKEPPTEPTPPSMQSKGGKARWVGISAKGRSEEMSRIARKRWASKKSK